MNDRISAQLCWSKLEWEAFQDREFSYVLYNLQNTFTSATVSFAPHKTPMRYYSGRALLPPFKDKEQRSRDGVSLWSVLDSCQLMPPDVWGECITSRGLADGMEVGTSSHWVVSFPTDGQSSPWCTPHPSCLMSPAQPTWPCLVPICSSVSTAVPSPSSWSCLRTTRWAWFSWLLDAMVRQSHSRHRGWTCLAHKWMLPSPSLPLSPFLPFSHPFFISFFL